MNIPSSYSSKRGFTLVEIALSLAIVAFALTAIIGVLPTGMTVQQDNREDTIINQDGLYILEAIRSGSRGMDELTNYVEQITHIVQNGNNRRTNSLPTPSQPLTGSNIVGLLTMPKISAAGTNFIFARMRSITGSAVDRPIANQPNDFGFRFQIQSEVTPVISIPPELVNDPMTLAMNLNIGENLHDVRLIVRWPLYERGNNWAVGRNRKVFRTQVGGKIVRSAGLNFFTPNQFTNAFAANP
ncbi:MAG: prepilin-type N-terminal cleavage/methylation domain-containing protein [Verrucomicrobiota bacterium]|nr:prepilin-type N-terminal cleavage/methylation domain-containing protein [Verrucomicrobiota bacterium]